MNIKRYKLIFSKRHQKFIAVGESASSTSKSGKSCRVINIIAVAVMSLFVHGLAIAAPELNALPSGASVVAGKVAIGQTGNTLTMNQVSNQAVVNWNSFNIGANAKVIINQPAANSIQLDRITGVNASQIFGQLSSNGQVILVNPNGIVFGKDGSVSASSFTASTLGISDADFLAGNYRYTRNGTLSAIENSGTIQAASGGYVALLGAQVTNHGQVIAPHGAAYLGSADAITVPVSSSGKIKLELSPAAINTSVVNSSSGLIVAEGGQVFLQSSALNDAAATAVSMVNNSGAIDVSSAQAGSVTLLSDRGNIQVSGVVAANSSDVNNKGGNITIGRDLDTGILSAITNVSGAKLEAKNGLVETSGSYLKANNVSVKAKEWLLDPVNVEINATSTASISGDSVVLAGDISSALNNGTSVTISTGTGAGSTSSTQNVAQSITGTTQGAGDIFVNENISKTTGGNVNASLSLIANRNILVAAGKSIGSTAGKLNVVMNANSGGTGGGIVFNAGSGISSNGGNISLGGGTALNGTGFAVADGANTLDGISLNTATIKAGGGDIVMNGQTAAADYQGNLSLVAGIYVNGGEISTTGSGKISLIGRNQNADTESRGFELTPGGTIATASGAVTIEGNSSFVTNSTFTYVRGALINGTVNSSGGDITITGRGGNAAQYDTGVDISGSVTTTGAGKINITGVAGSGSSGGDVGVNTSGTGRISSENGAITITGTGGIGNGSQIRDHGVSIGGTNAIASTGAGSISVAGTVTNADNGFSQGVIVAGGGLNTNSGNISVFGTVPTLYIQKAVNISAPVRSTSGNIFLQSAGAGITTSGVGTLTASNISIDNSNGQIDVVTGAITPGTLGATAWPGYFSQVGIDINAAVTATNNLNIYGNQTASDNGLRIGANISSAYINAVGNTSTGTNGFAWNGGSINVTGTSGASTNSIVKGISGASTTASNGYGAFMMYANGSANAAAGTTLSLIGQATTLVAGQNTKERGILVQAGRILTMSGDVTLEGSSSSSEGIAFGGTLNMSTVSGVTNKLTMKGTAAASSNAGLYGLNFSGAINSSNSSTSSINFIGDAKNTSGTNWDNSVNIATTGTGIITGGANFNVQADTLAISSGSVINAGTTGVVSLQSLTAGNQINLGGADTNSAIAGNRILGLSQAELNGITAKTLAIGNATAGNITVGGPVTTNALSGDLQLLTGANVAINSTLAVGGTPSTKNLTINASGLTSSVTQTADIQAAGLELLGSNATDTLMNANNAFINIAANVKTLSINDHVSMTVGTVNTTTGVNTAGPIKLISDGAINVNAGVTTSDATSSAIIVASGNSDFVGTTTNDIVVSTAGSLTSGVGGLISLYTGSVAGSTSVANLIGAGKFRYNSKLGTNNYTQALGTSGLNLIYREAPTLTYQVNNASKTYDGLAYTGGNGVTYSSGAVNNDLFSIGTVSYGGTAQNAINANSTPYTLTGSVAGVNALGYLTAFNSGTLTVNKADAIVTANTGSTIYNGADQTITGFTVSGLLGTDTASSALSGISASLSKKDAGIYATSASGTATNYNLTFVNGSLTINKAHAVVTADTVNATYSGQAQSVSTYQVSGLLAGDTSSALNVSVTGGGVNSGTYVTSATGTAANYDLTFQPGLLNITKAPISIALDSKITTYGNIVPLTYTVNGLVNHETASSAGISLNNIVSAGYAGPSTTNNVGRYAITTTTAPGQSYANYYLTSVSPGVLEITPATLTFAVQGVSKLVTQVDPRLTYSVSGLVNGDTSSAYTAPSVSRVAGESAGVYAINLAGGNASNYNVVKLGGDFTILGAQQLLITMSGVNSTYGTLRTPTVSSVQYLDQNNLNFYNLVNTGGNSWSDSVGGVITITPTLSGVSALSNVGVYANAVTNNNTGIAASHGNFIGVHTQAANYVVNPAVLTISANNVNRTYDGTIFNSLSPIPPSVSANGFMNGEALTTLGGISFTGDAINSRNAGTYTVNAIANSNPNGNYLISYQPGILVTAKANLAVVGDTVTNQYNGSAQTHAYTITGFVGGDTAISTGLTITGLASRTNVGQTSDDLTTRIVSDNYDVNTVNGGITITKNTNATVVITGNSNNTTYNGLSQTASGFTATGLVGNDTAANISGVVDIAATGRNAGTYNHVVSGDLANYSHVTFVNGALNIAKNTNTSVVITGNSNNTTYNGLSQTASGFTATGLVGEDTATNVSGIVDVAAIGTNAGTYNHVLSGDLANYSHVNFVNGALNIAKANLTVTGDITTRAYTGLMQTNTYRAAGFVGADTVASIGLRVDGLASRTSSGVTDDVLTAGINSDNYIVQTLNGSLTVTQGSTAINPVTVSNIPESKAVNHVAEDSSSFATVSLDDVGQCLADDSKQCLCENTQDADIHICYDAKS